MLQAVHERRAELLQPSPRELHLGLDAHRSDNATPRRAPEQVLQQRGLADARLTAQDQNRPLRSPGTGNQPIQRLALAAPTTEPPVGAGLQHATVDPKPR